MNVEINWKISLPAALHDSKNLERLVENFKLSFYKVMESRRLTARILYWYNDSLRQTHTHLVPGRSTIKGKQSLSKDHQQRETHFWNYFHEKNYQLRKYPVSESKKKLAVNLVWSLTISRHVASDLLLDSFGKPIRSVLRSKFS